MNQGVRNTEELLVLTCSPKDAKAPIDWRLFKNGNTLGEMVTAHNLRLDGLLQLRTPKDFRDCLRGIKPALTIGACLAKDMVSQGSERFGNVKILLLDLDSGEMDLQRMELIGQHISDLKQVFHLVQVSRSSQPVSWAGFFADNSRLLPTEPDVFTKQAELENFLHHFRKVYEEAWMGVVDNPLDAPCLEKVYNEPYVHPSHGYFLKPGSKEGQSVERLYRLYRMRLAGLLMNIRDASIARHLSEQETTNLGRNAAMQELLLTLVAESARPQPDYPVSVEPIRRALSEIPADQPVGLKDLVKMRLLVTHRLKPVSLLDDQQKQLLIELGVSYGILTAVHYDQPEIWNKISQLEGIVKGERLTAELIDWPAKRDFRPVRLNEVSVGLNIEESLSKDMEVQ